MIFLRPGETIYLIKRRHKTILMQSLFPELIIFFAIIGAMIVIFFAPIKTLPSFVTDMFPAFSEFDFRFLLLYFLSLLLLLFWIIIFLTVTNYYLDAWIVTNERTVHIELKGLFSRTTSSINHDKIQDITIDVHGFLPTMFNFGNLSIETAGQFHQFIFQDIPSPYKTKEVIFKAQKEFLKNKREEKKDEIHEAQVA